MGFNPGGSPDKIKRSVEESLRDEKLKGNFCSYEDKCWRKSCPMDCQNPEHFGKSLHQRRVKELAKILGYNIREVFAANAIFVRSNNQDSLAERETLFDNCWPIHQIFLSIVQPTVILCLGNGEESSAFAFLRKKLASGEKHHGRVKEFMGEILLPDRRTIRSRVIGVHHPSCPWFDPVKDLRSHFKTYGRQVKSTP
jgi:hypothetical protein